MEELIDIVTSEGKPTGKVATKSDIHTKGLFHHTAHIWFYTKSGQILLSQRAASKMICPLLWDVSVAGHVDAGESIEQAAIRETKEEIGLAIKKESLKKIGVTECFQSYSNGIQDNEFHNTFIVELVININDLKINTDEVEAIKLVTVKEFQSFINIIEDSNHFVASNKSYYEFVLKHIKEAIKN